MSSEHVTVDGTLIEAWASRKSFVLKDEIRRDDDDPGNSTVNFRGEQSEQPDPCVDDGSGRSDWRG